MNRRTPIPRTRTEMISHLLVRQPRSAWTRAVATPLLLLAGACATANVVGTAPVPAPPAASSDPRVGLSGGWNDAGEAASNLELVSHVDRPEGFFNPADAGDFGVINTDMAFSGTNLFLGSYHGFQVWDVSNPAQPTLRTSLVCPGGQGDLSVYRNLLFMSVEETRGRVDCGTQGVQDTVSADRFRGVRIFDIGNLDQPRQVASIQTCRGSHTHTLVTKPGDTQNVYVYISGTGGVRPGAELKDCSGLPPEEDPNTSLFRIEVVQVPLAVPQQAKIVSTPRIFADPATGAIAGLNPGGDQGPDAQEGSQTSRCHDITVYPEIGLAAGACAGNGILLDISDPVHPRRVDEVTDPNFAFWHSATFNNDGSKVIFTDEWGGGTQPRCQASDRPEWGADAIFTLNGRELRPAGYFKLPAPQTEVENCVAHNGSLIPVPGRDLMVQAWYQGGVSVFDFGDPSSPVEIAFFDRGPIDPAELTLAGYWSTYWYNGAIYGSEIGRGLDVFRLTPSEHLSASEIAAAQTVRRDWFNPQLQQKLTWPPSPVVARAYLDQLARNDGLAADRVAAVRAALERAEGMQGAAREGALAQLATELEADSAGARDAARVRALTAVVRALAG